MFVQDDSQVKKKKEECRVLVFFVKYKHILKFEFKLSGIYL